MTGADDHLTAEPSAQQADGGDRASAFVRTVAVDALGESTIAEMFALFERYYDDVCDARFRADLADKTHAILLIADDQRIVGFSTVRWYPIVHQGNVERVIFSGDTIIDRRWWGTQLLATAFCRLAGRLKGRHPAVPLWWFLISKGHRTYRYLPAFARRFHPSLHEPTPAAIRQRMDHLAGERFGSAYDAARGIVHFSEPHGHLKPRWQASRIRDDDAGSVAPASRFFEQCNPGFAGGDELVCLTELARSNLRRVALASFVAGLGEAMTDDRAALDGCPSAHGSTDR